MNWSSASDVTYHVFGVRNVGEQRVVLGQPVDHSTRQEQPGALAPELAVAALRADHALDEVVEILDLDEVLGLGR